MTLPTRDEIVAIGMEIYHYTFILITIAAVITVAIIISHLIPRKEY